MVKAVPCPQGATTESLPIAYAWRMRPFAALFRRRRARAAASEAPPGVDDVRLLDTPDAVLMAETASMLAAIDQAAGALEMVRQGSRRPTPDPRAALADLALLRFGVVQFVDCFEAGRRAGLVHPAEAFARLDGGLAFYRHLCAFRDELSGPHARLVGETETVALFRRVREQLILAGVATRIRRPDRLTAAEVAQILTFIGHAREVWVDQLQRLRARVADQVRDLPQERLGALPPATGR